MKGEEKRGLGVMSEPNLAKAQALVMAWRFPLPSYLLRRTCSHTRRVLLALILAASYSLLFSPLAPSLTSYSSCCMVQLPAVCHSESCVNHVTKLAIILVASYSPLYSPRLTRSHTRRILLAIVLTAGTLIDIVLVTVYCTTSRCLCHAESYADLVTKLAIILVTSYSLPYPPHLTRSHTRRVLPAIVLAASTLIDIILAASYARSYFPRPTCYCSRCRHPD